MRKCFLSIIHTPINTSEPTWGLSQGYLAIRLEQPGIEQPTFQSVDPLAQEVEQIFHHLLIIIIIKWTVFVRDRFIKINAALKIKINK